MAKINFSRARQKREEPVEVGSGKVIRQAASPRVTDCYSNTDLLW